MATGRYNLRSRKAAQENCPPAGGDKGGNAVNDVATTAPVAEGSVPSPVVKPVAGADVSQSPLTPSPPGSWEQVSRSRRASPSSHQHLDADARSHVNASIPRSENRYNILGSLPDSDSVQDKEVESKETLPTVFAINPLDEPNEELSREQLEAVNQAEASLTPEQHEAYQRRHSGLQPEAAANSSKDKGKGIDPRNWGAISDSDDEMNVNTQKVLFESVRNHRDSEKHKHSKHKKRSKTKEKEHRKKSKKAKKAKYISSKENFPKDSTRGESTSSHNQDGVGSHIRHIWEASKGKNGPRMNNVITTVDDNLRPSRQIDPKSYLGRAFADARASSMRPSESGNHKKKTKHRSKHKKSKSKHSKGKRNHKE
ncbi:hypothetical protein AN958_11344 [Leucoagaricus sp. SymC.cos]|nr:hypothetical protein AN958_11344 [Leucoagaricus sp. SymC.cos]